MHHVFIQAILGNKYRYNQAVNIANTLREDPRLNTLADCFEIDSDEIDKMYFDIPSSWC